MGKSGRKGLRKRESDDSESDTYDEDDNAVKAPVPPKRPGPPRGAPRPMSGMAAALKSGRKVLRKVDSDDSESDTDDEDANAVKASVPPKRPGPPQGAPRPMSGMAAALKSGRKGLRKRESDDSESDTDDEDDNKVKASV